MQSHPPARGDGAGSSGLSPGDEHGERRAGQQELHACREGARLVPAEAVVEELSAPGAQERKNVLEVWGRARRGADGRRIERPPSQSQEQDACDAATDLEASRANVLVWQAIARKVDDRP
jgi:hypothetical protein